MDPQGSKLVATGESDPARQGTAVSLSADGNTALVGGYTSGSTGAAWIWTRSGGVWTQQGLKLVGTGAVGVTQQGTSVALSGDGNTAMVGGRNDNSGQGAVWVWTRNGGGVWTQQGPKRVGTGAVGIPLQGQSVALSGDGNTALVGGFQDNGFAGATWLWTRTAGAWTQQGSKLVGTGAVGNAQQGAHVALSADGNTALVGGDLDNGGAGAAWVFTTAVPPSPVTIASSPSGLAFTVSGVGCPTGSYTAPRTLVWSPASSCDVSFATPQLGTPGTQYVFTAWADGPTTASRSIASPSATYTANFKTQYLLTTAVNPVGAGFAGGSAYYDAGSTAQFSAIANAGYIFVGWTGGPNASAANAAPLVAVNNPLNMTANFVQATVTTGSVRYFAYVANQDSYTVTGYAIDPSNGALTPIAGSPFATGANPQSVTVHPSGKFAYVTNGGSNNVSAFSINPTTGALTTIGSPVTSGTTPQFVTVHNSGKFAYVVNYLSDNVSTYSVDAATGALTPVGAPVAVGTRPYSMAIDPSGKYAYVANIVSFNVTAFSIDQTTGALTRINNYTAGNQAISAVVEPTGKYAFVANSFSGTVGDISAYLINAGTGELASVAGSPFPITGTNPISMVVEPTGRFAYVANYGSSNISVYSIFSGSGALAPVGTPVATGFRPNHINLEPQGKFAYVANYGTNQVSAYRMNSSTGALSPVGVFAAGTSPRSIATVAVVASTSVTIASSPAGRTFTVTGTGCAAGPYTTPQTLAWIPGSNCTVTFTTPQSGAPGTQYAFTAWADGPTTALRSIAAPATATIYTASFKTQYALITSVSPTASGTVTGAGWFDSGGVASVSATPAAGYRFLNWTGPAAAAFSASTTVTMSGPQSVTANFELDQTPAVITPTVNGQLGSNGWYIGPVTVSWSVTDPQSGIASSSGCAQTTLTADTPGTTLTCSAINGAGLSSSVPLTIKIDTSRPVISGMPGAGCSLWPPNHKMVQVAMVTASDVLSGLAAGSFSITGTSNEPSSPNEVDIVIAPNGTGGFTVQLRAERLGTGTGRVYTLTAKATDTSGNVTVATSTCTVPHDQGK